MDEKELRAGSDLRKLLSEAIARSASGMHRFVTTANGGTEQESADVVRAVLMGATEEALSDPDALRPGRVFGAVRRRVAQLTERARRDPSTMSGAMPADWMPASLRAIRPTEREALLIRYVGGLAWSDVAIACGTDEATAKERVSRALLQLSRASTQAATSASPPDLQAMRRTVERHLADVVDGLASDEVADFAAEDDVMRDLVHDAEQAIGSIRAIAAAHVLDIGKLEREVVTGLSIAGPVSTRPPPPVATTEGADAPEAPEPVPPASVSAPPEAPAKTASMEATTSVAASPEPTETMKAVDPAPAAPAKKPAPAVEPAAPAAPAARFFENLTPKGRAGIVVGAAALIAGLAFVVGRGSKAGAGDAWSGKVDTVSGHGFERCAPDSSACTGVKDGDSVPAGSMLRTDGQTRAVVLLADGTRVVLDHDTDFILDGTAARRAELKTGAAILDVADVGGARARVDVPLGYIEAGAAKLSLEAAPDLVELEVVRGAVRLTDSKERGILVRAGETGHVDPGSAPEVFATSVLGGSLRWGERAFSPPGAEGAGDIAGLGELKAQKPGETKERKGAVTLTSHFTKVRIAGNVARTEIEEEFANGSDDVLEGIYRFPLPPDAQIERLALDVDGKLVDGAFVDRERAAAIWRGAIVNAGAKKPVGEEIVWVPGPWRDPALLEWQRGGRFELRIYPIPKHGSRKVVLAYTQVLPPSGDLRRYVYPLPANASGGTRVGRFDLDVQVRGHDPKAKIAARGYALRHETAADGVQSLTMTAQNFEPSGDLTIEYSLPEKDAEVTAWAYQPAPDERQAANAFQPTSTFRDLVSSPGTGVFGDSAGAAYVALALRPKLPHVESDGRRSFAVIVDSSRSMFGERYRRASDLAAKVALEMDRGDRLTVLACDSTCAEMPGGGVVPGEGGAHAVSDFLGKIAPEGGSDVTGAIRRARGALGSVPDGSARIVYIGDGTPTIGAVLPAFVSREVTAAVPRSAGTITTVAIGADADTNTLRTVAQAGGGAMVPYVPGQSLREAAYAVLGASYGSTLADAEVELPDGLIEAAPATLPTMLSGSETLVAYRMTKPVVEGTLVLRGNVLGKRFEQKYPLHVEATTGKGNAFVPRLWAAAEIADLERLPDAASRQRAVGLSQQYHVASRHTSLLVLESQAMFQAFGLERLHSQAQWTGEEDATSTTADSEANAAKGEAALDKAKGASSQYPGSAEKKKQDDYDFEGEDEYAASGSIGRSAGGGDLSRARSGPAAAEAPATAAEPRDMPSPAPKAAPMPSQPVYPAKPAPPRAPYPNRDLAFDDDGWGGGGMAYAPPPPPRPRRMIPMRKVWERTARIVAPVDIPAITTEVIAAAERAADGDTARTPLKSLYMLYFKSGDVERAASVAERWSAKDPLDPDALTARADVAAARGERDAAIRILGSVVDVRPGDHKAQWRLARLHRWAGRAELGCRHSSAVAQIRTSDAKSLSEAVRCAREVGQSGLASDLLSAADAATRTAAERLLTEPAADPSALNGDITLTATWDSGDDLDLSMLEPEGYRVSWLGAPTKAIITANDVQSTQREGLALRGSSPGDYVVEITRPKGHAGTIRGTLQVVAAGERRSVPFILDGGRTRLALIKVSAHSKLVPL